MTNILHRPCPSNSDFVTFLEAAASVFLEAKNTLDQGFDNFNLEHFETLEISISIDDCLCYGDFLDPFELSLALELIAWTCQRLEDLKYVPVHRLYVPYVFFGVFFTFVRHAFQTTYLDRR
jgi:hypothetical protein